jgi:hypothetical protein
MQDMSDAVDEEHHLLLEALCGVSEVPHITEAKDRTDQSARAHEVQLATIRFREILCDDCGACFTKPNAHKATDLVDGLQEESGLHTLQEAILLAQHGVLDPERVLGDLLHQTHHLLDRNNDKSVHIRGEVVSAHLQSVMTVSGRGEEREEKEREEKERGGGGRAYHEKEEDEDGEVDAVESSGDGFFADAELTNSGETHLFSRGEGDAIRELVHGDL